MEEKKALTRITGGILGFLLLGTLLAGVPVPTRPPFIGLTIKTDKETYDAGDTAIITFIITNRTPFKIRLKPFSHYETRIYPVEHPERFSSMVDDVPPRPGEPDMVLWPFDSTTLNGHTGVQDLKKGEYMVTMTLEGHTISKTFQVD